MEQLIKAVAELRGALLKSGMHPIDTDQIRISLPFKVFDVIRLDLKSYCSIRIPDEERNGMTEDCFMLCGIEFRRKPIGMIGDDCIPLREFDPPAWTPMGYRRLMDGTLVRDEPKHQSLDTSIDYEDPAWAAEVLGDKERWRDHQWSDEEIASIRAAIDRRSTRLLRALTEAPQIAQSGARHPSSD